ncbi:MAG TPA: dihydropteroate synthase, partial [Candidatus Omnitrophica bacterium]|nr:dihydropteroate synthase [Candidatus Omnitrophota bacterium]
MILIGENMNVMNKRIRQAMKERNKEVVQEIAIREKESGVDYLDINIGPARKQGGELMRWMVETIQEVVDLPLSLDTTNVEAMEEGLKAHRGANPIINSISARPERMGALLPLVKKYDASFIALLLGVEGIPRDEAERGALAAEMLARFDEEGISHDKVYFDPIILPISSQQNQVQGCTRFMEIFPELAPDCNSTGGLSNVSNGTPDELRPILNRTYLLILMNLGLSSVILDAFDEEIIKIAKGERKDLQELVKKVMDGEEPPSESLTQEQRDYLKTAKVLLGHSLYSHSWLK